MHYLDYNNMKDFYTVQELANLLGLSKEQLRMASQQCHIEPKRNQQEQWGFDRWQSCQIHNKLYKEQAHQANDGPWA